MKVCKNCNKEKPISEFRKNILKGREYIRGECKQCEIIKDKIYKEKNKLKTIEFDKKHHKEYYIKHKDEINRKNNLYYYKNKDKIMSKQKLNKEHRNELQKLKRQEDKLYKIKYQVKNLINNSFVRRKYRKNSHTQEIVGIDLETLYIYLLKTYKDNYGIELNETNDVHIDHIIPLSTARTEEEIIKLCHYTNLQLLKAEDNIKKGNKVNWMLGELL
jgi:hypothetical protein